MPETSDPDELSTPEVPAGRLEEREQRQHAEQQHGDTFAVESDEPTDTSGVPRHGAGHRIEALPGEPDTDYGDQTRGAGSE